MSYDAGEDSFGMCTALKKAVLAEGLETISNALFFQCSALEELSFPLSLKKIGDYAFYSCGKLATIHYAGSAAQLDQVQVGDANGSLAQAKVEYGSGS